MKKFVWDSPSVQNFQAFKEYILQARGEDEEARRILLACEEIFVNIVSYSGAGRAQICVENMAGGLAVSFIDDGAAFDPTEYGAEKDFDELSEGGMGIAMAKSIASKMLYERTGGHNALTLVFGSA